MRKAGLRDHVAMLADEDRWIDGQTDGLTVCSSFLEQVTGFDSKSVLTGVAAIPGIQMHGMPAVAAEFAPGVNPGGLMQAASVFLTLSLLRCLDKLLVRPACTAC